MVANRPALVVEMGDRGSRVSALCVVNRDAAARLCGAGARWSVRKPWIGAGIGPLPPFLEVFGAFSDGGDLPIYKGYPIARSHKGSNLPTTHNLQVHTHCTLLSASLNTPSILLLLPFC